MGPDPQIRAVRDNLLLAVAFWSAARNGLINAASLNKPMPADAVSAMLVDRLKVSRDEELLLGAANQIRGAFGVSVMRVSRTMESVYGKFPLHENDSDLRSARCIVYLLDRAMSADLLEPVWVCPPAYRQKFEVQAPRFVLDTTRLGGQKISWNDFGGLDKYLDLLDYCIAQVERAPERPLVQEYRPQPSALKQHGSSSNSSDEGDAIPAFIASRCVIDPGGLVMAKDLYGSYLTWCNEIGASPLPQRSFGMRLTECGFKRKRMGRGRHWWQGIELAGE